MGAVVSFENYRPVARYDSLPWTHVRVDESGSSFGPWDEIDQITLDPVDVDPASPLTRSFTTTNATEGSNWYRIVWLDAALDEAQTLPIQNIPALLSPYALCTDEDVRLFLGIKSSDLEDDDRSVLIRLVNAASEVFRDDSQRVWIGGAGTRVYTVNGGSEIRLDDLRSIESAGYGLVDETPSDFTSYTLLNWDNSSEPPYTRLRWTIDTPIQSGMEIAVSGVYGWADNYEGVPEKVRHAVTVAAAEWYARDVQKFSATFSLEENRVFIPRMLPSSVQAIAESYRRFRVA